MTKSLDKILLLIGVVALGASAAFVGLKLVNPPKTPDTGASTGEALGPYDLKPFQPAASLQVATDSGNRAWVSEDRVKCDNEDFVSFIPSGKKVCPHCGLAQKDPATQDDDEDGIYNGRETAFGMDPRDPTDAWLDADEDGFFNVEEVGIDVAVSDQTDPTDPNSHPPFIDDLCVAGVKNNPDVILLEGVTKLDETNRVFNLNFKTKDGTWFARVGQEKHGYRLVDYTEDIKKGEGKIVNNSFVMLENLASGEKLKLPINKSVDRDRRQVKLVYVRDPEIKVPILKPGASFAIREESYTVVSIGRDRVKITRKSDGKEITVYPCTDEQEDEYKSRRNPDWTPNTPSGFTDDLLLDPTSGGRFLPDLRVEPGRGLRRPAGVPGGGNAPGRPAFQRETR